MEAKRFTKKQLLEMGFTLAVIKGLTPVESVKTGKRGRPAALYSEEQVEAAKAGVKPVVTQAAEVTSVEGVESVEPDQDSDPTGGAQVTPEAPAADLTEADFAQAA